MLDVDVALVDAARNGANMDELIAATWPEAYRISYAIVRDAGLAEDCAQEACAKIARSLAALKEIQTFRAWAYRLIVNVAISQGRKRKPVASLDSVQHLARADDVAMRIDLEIALAALPVEQRAVIVLHYYAGLTSEEIAGTSGVRASTVRFRLMLARRALEKSLRLVDAPQMDGAQGVSHG